MSRPGSCASPHLCPLMSGRLGLSALSAARGHIYLRQHSVCCHMRLNHLISVKLWFPAADSRQCTTSSPSSTPAGPAHGGPHCSGSSAPRQPPKGEGTSHVNLSQRAGMQQDVQWCPGKTRPATSQMMPFFQGQQVAGGGIAQGNCNAEAIINLRQNTLFKESVHLCLGKYLSS